MFMLLTVASYGTWLILLLNGYIYHVDGTEWMLLSFIAGCVVILIRHSILSFWTKRVSNLQPSIHLTRKNADALCCYCNIDALGFFAILFARRCVTVVPNPKRLRGSEESEPYQVVVDMDKLVSNDDCTMQIFCKELHHRLSDFSATVSVNDPAGRYSLSTFALLLKKTLDSKCKRDSKHKLKFLAPSGAANSILAQNFAILSGIFLSSWHMTVLLFTKIPIAFLRGRNAWILVIATLLSICLSVFLYRSEKCHPYKWLVPMIDIVRPDISRATTKNFYVIL